MDNRKLGTAYSMLPKPHPGKKVKEGDAAPSPKAAAVPTELLEKMLDIAVNACDRKRVGEGGRIDARRRDCT